MSQIESYFESQLKRFLAASTTFINIESPSYDVEGSRQAVDFLSAETRQIACVTNVERVFREGYGEHLLIRAFGDENSGERQILLLGHTDTVHPRGSLSLNPTRTADGKFYGCGAFDMKLNALLCLELLRACDALGVRPSKPVTILLSCDEEIGSDTGRELVEAEARKSDVCLVLEPSKNGLAKTGRKGTAWFEISAKGIPSHAGLEPEKGASAILELARQTEKLHSLNDYAAGTTVNVTLFKGGTTSNVIAENASMEVDVRFQTTAEAERIISIINSLPSFDEKVALHIEGGLNRPPLERSENTLGVYEKAQKIAERLGFYFGETQVGGASDGNFSAALGVPTLDGLGLRGDGAHTHDEFIFIADIVPRAAFLLNLLISI